MNPDQIINMLMQNNPQIQNNPVFNNAFQMAQANNVQGLQNLAQNIAKSKGVDLNQIKQQVSQFMK